MDSAQQFSELPVDHRILQSWIILISKARNRQTITYADLATLMLGESAGAYGKRAPQWKGLSLGHIYKFCKSHELPLLPVIVVAKKTGEPVPVKELYEGRSVGIEREHVFDFDWYKIYPPLSSAE